MAVNHTDRTFLSPDGVAMDPVKKPLDDAKGDEAAHVDVGQHVGVAGVPFTHGEALAQTRKQLHNAHAVNGVAFSGQRPDLIVWQAHRRRGQPAGPPLRRTPVHDRLFLSARRKCHVHVPRTLLLHLRVLGDHVRKLGRHGVDVVEAEDVQQQDAAVVQEVLDAFLGEFDVGVGQRGDAFDAVDSVDERDDAQHGQVPILVDHGVDAHGEERDVPGLDARRVGQRREEFDVERVEFVDGDHAFTVVVQVFHEHLTQTVDLARVAGGVVVGQEMGLLFQTAHQVGQLLDHRFV